MNHTNLDVSQGNARNTAGGVLSEQWVKVTLDGMFYGRAARLPNPLEHLTLVDQVLADPAFPLCARQRTVALHELLTSLIQTELHQQRRRLGLSAELSDESDEPLYQRIAYDASACNRELVGWSWLYYRYVRVERDVQALAFCQACHIDERTLRRYRARAVTRLTELLIEREWRARRLLGEHANNGVS